MGLLMRGYLVSSCRQMSYYGKYVKPNLILPLAGFCHYILVHIPSATQEIAKEKWKKTINHHNNFIHLKIFSDIFLNFALNFHVSVSQWRHVFAYVSYIQLYPHQLQ